MKLIVMHIFTEAARRKHAINSAKKKMVTERKGKQSMKGLDNDYHWKNINQAWEIKDCEYTKA